MKDCTDEGDKPAGQTSNFSLNQQNSNILYEKQFRNSLFSPTHQEHRYLFCYCGACFFFLHVHWYTNTNLAKTGAKGNNGG